MVGLDTVNGIYTLHFTQALRGLRVVCCPLIMTNRVSRAAVAVHDRR
jgi:hypothetical protein